MYPIQAQLYPIRADVDPILLVLDPIWVDPGMLNLDLVSEPTINSKISSRTFSQVRAIPSHDVDVYGVHCSLRVVYYK